MYLDFLRKWLRIYSVYKISCCVFRNYIIPVAKEDEFTEWSDRVEEGDWEAEMEVPEYAEYVESISTLQFPSYEVK